MARTKTPANIVGPQIAAFRRKQGLTQEEFAAQCQVAGFDVSRGTISQIEARLRCVTDDELLKLATVLHVRTDDLFPERKKRSR
jgi:transcriptional regulator with XRE-family HTH domain